MPGAGTRPATTAADPPARCLDVTRLVSRVGRGPWTGIDRVEWAYLRELLSRDAPLFLLCRTAFGHVLLDRTGASALRDRLVGTTPWGRKDLVGRLSRRLPPARRRAESDLRRLALARTRKSGLATMLTRHLPAGSVYLNVGHTDLDTAVLDAWRQLDGARIVVMVHDTIPLDHPGYQRPGTPERFAGLLARIGQNADLVLYNSAATRESAERHFRTRGRVPPAIVAHLGVDPPAKPGTMPIEIAADRALFVTLGTIEPRKNHALLLDVWKALRKEMPQERLPLLVTAGSRGWLNKEVFARLDALTPEDGIIEVSGLTDAAIAALLDRATAFLFPSRAEGYGLPPLEAARRGTPVICANLPVYREILGDYPVYGDPDDVYFWKQTIRNMAESMQAGQRAGARGRAPVTLPDWRDHFKVVFSKA